MNLVRKTNPNFQLVWIGAKRTGFVDNFEWSNDETFNYSNWDIGEPSNSGINKSGVAMFSSGKWTALNLVPDNESRYDNLGSLVCERKLINESVKLEKKFYF